MMREHPQPHEVCATVKVKAENEQGHIVINEVDFDPTVHEPLETPKSLMAPVKAETQRAKK